MAKINFLPWRDELREQRKKKFVTNCTFSALMAVAVVALAWFFYDQKLSDQRQANQLITSTNQTLDAQFQSLGGLQERRNTIVERMRLIQGLEGRRPIIVHLVDELVRIIPDNMYITKFSRVDDKFMIEGKADSPNTVAEFLRNLEVSPWYRNAFMNSFLAAEEKQEQTTTSVLPRVEESYGSFIVTADLGEIGIPTSQDNNSGGGSNMGSAQ